MVLPICAQNVPRLSHNQLSVYAWKPPYTPPHAYSLFYLRSINVVNLQLDRTPPTNQATKQHDKLIYIFGSAYENVEQRAHISRNTYTGLPFGPPVNCFAIHNVFIRYFD